MKMKIRVANHLCGQHKGRNLRKKSVTWTPIAKISYLKTGDKPLGFLIVLGGATSHVDSLSLQKYSPSEVIAKLHEWMDTFQMNPKAICADMAFHQLHAECTTKRESQPGPHAPWPNRTEMGVRLFEKFLSALVDTASKNLDQTALAQITLAQLIRKAATVRNTQVTLKWQDAHGMSCGRQTKRSPEPSFHESRTAYIHIRSARSRRMSSRCCTSR